MDQHANQEQPEKQLATIVPPDLREPISARQWTLAFAVLAYGVGASAWWILGWNAKADTAATYVGIPTLLAFLLATTPRARSKTGAILKGMAISLFFVGATLGPGIVCILVSLPLFLLIGVVVGRLLDAPSAARDRAIRVSVVALVLAMASVEGLHPMITFDPRNTVVVSRVLSITPAQFEARLARAPTFNQPLPFPLNLGFPAPIRAEGQGLQIGARRSVYLEDRNVYYTLIGKSGQKDGTVVFEVANVTHGDRVGLIGESGFVRFRPLADDSHVSKWLTWIDSNVVWKESPQNARLWVTWTVTFDRKLAPAWYFGPILRYAVEQAVSLMLDTVAAQDD